MLEVIFSSLGYAGGVISDKLVLSKYRVPVIRFVSLLFIWLAAITAVFLKKWGGGMDFISLFSTPNIFILLLLIVVALWWNIYYYQGIQKENLHEFELIMLLSPLATIVFATIFLPIERDWGIFVPSIIAALTLVLTRFRKHHVVLGKTAWKTIIAMVLMSFEAILIKELLNILSPVALYFIRTIILAIAFLIIYRPKVLTMHRNAFALTILSAIFGVVQMVLKFYGFRNLGVVETTMILVLGPFLVYIASSILFKEKLYKRDLFAAVVVVLCILYVEFWR